MQRRDFVKAFLAATVSAKAMAQSAPSQVTPSTAPPTPPGSAAPPAPGPTPWMRGLLDVRQLPMTPLVPDAVAMTSTYYFSQKQMATLRQLCEILLPPLKRNPGALDAGTPEFLDFLISISPQDRQQLYTLGLDRLDREAHANFDVGFDSVSVAQADKLIRPYLRTWMPDHPPQDPYTRFINVAHSDIRTATINSKAWNDAALHQGDEPTGVGLYWYPVEPDMEERYLPHRSRYSL